MQRATSSPDTGGDGGKRLFDTRSNALSYFQAGYPGTGDGIGDDKGLERLHGVLAFFQFKTFTVGIQHVDIGKRQVRQVRVRLENERAILQGIT